MTVYIVSESGDRHSVKIGFTNYPSISRRLDSLQTGNPTELVILGEITDGSLELERALHDHFREYHLRGEWFDIPTNVLHGFLDEWVRSDRSENEVLAHLQSVTPVNISKYLPPVHCRFCDRVIPNIISSKRIYCSSSCRTKAWQERKKNNT